MHPPVRNACFAPPRSPLPRWLLAAAGLLAASDPLTLHAQGASAPSAASPSVAAAPSWKQIFENRQAVYYVSATPSEKTSQLDVSSLVEYKLAQVIDGDQVWSVVAHIRLDCSQNRMVTLGNTLYAQKMGAGAVVQAQASGDTWHQPQPGSLGGLIWKTACGSP